MKNFTSHHLSSPMAFTDSGSDTPISHQSNHSSLDSDLLRLRSQIFESISRKTDLIRANHVLAHERDELRRENRELEAEVSMIREEMKRDLQVSRERVGELEGETKDINVLLRAALSEKKSAKKQSKETNEEKRSVLLQIAERGLQRIGLGFGFRETENVADDQEEEEEESAVVTAIEKTMKSLRQEISQVKISLEESRLEEERLKKITEEQAQRVAENTLYIDKLQNRERSLTQNVEELGKVIKEAESEVSRWREACELEVEAGQREVELREQLIAVLKAEVEKMRSALAISQGKLKMKEELAKAAMAAEEAAEKSLRLAERRIAELLKRIERFNRQLEEAESTERRNRKSRYIWCWPLWSLPTATADGTATSSSSYIISNRALVRYGA